jgi:putative hemolysin
MQDTKQVLSAARYVTRHVARGVVLGGFLVTAACSDQGPGDAAGDNVGLPNPAAVFCEEQGGEYLLDSGECRLADGTVVDAWDHYRENAEAGQ